MFVAPLAGHWLWGFAAKVSCLLVVYRWWTGLGVLCCPRLRALDAGECGARGAQPLGMPGGSAVGAGGARSA